MRSSTLLASCFASLAIASPVRHAHAHNKKAIVWDVVTDLVVVTVTADADAASSTSITPVHAVVVVSETVWVDAPEESTSSTSIAIPSTTSVSTTEVPAAPTTTSIVPVAIPSTTSEDPVVVIVTEAAAATTTSEAPAVVIVTEAAAAATTSEAPVLIEAAVAAVTEAAVEVTAAAVPTVVEAAASAGTTSFVIPTTAAAKWAAADIDSVVGNHGTARSAHSVASLTWNATLAEYAAELASSCVWGHDFSAGGGNYGQNIAVQASSDASAYTVSGALDNSITDEWYSEASLFASLYGQDSPSQSGGEWTHFTQMVWKSSESVGCAVAYCPQTMALYPSMNSWYTVCNYYPVGNVVGYFAENVLA